MEGYTHVAVGITVTLLMSKQMGIGITPELLIPISVGALGGLIPDVDIPDKNDNTVKAPKKKRMIFIVVVAILLMFVFWRISDEKNFDKIISSSLIFIAFIIIFTTQPHRHFSHSLLGIGIITFAMSRINIFFGALLLIALLSHLALDILNKTPVHFTNFIPKLKKGFCFKLVNSSNKTVNMVITGIAITISIFLLFLMAKK